ncbi:MAG TPA: polyphosphate kinase 1, partial [Bacteroidia bacterium]|nr:polyphosphate kinase 1 [Bacteroidia bacterium]
QLGVQGLKVHSKLVHIVRRESGRDRSYTVLGTGNFNEDTAAIFADHLLFTYNQEIGQDTSEIFRFFRQSYLKPRLTHLHIAPFDIRNFLKERIEREIANHAEGKPAGISVKMNNFSDKATNALLCSAAEEGVPVRMIVRSMYSLVVEDGSPIQAISIVDKYLEHSRMMIFENGGDRAVFLTSADFMPRNFDTRVETVFPVYDEGLKSELVGYYEAQWRDNTKARELDRNLLNGYRSAKKGPRYRAQFDIEEYLRRMVEG